MPDILIRDLDVKTVRRLKEKAKEHGRSLQREVRSIIEEATLSYSKKEALQIAEYWQKRFKGRKFSDSAEDIREDRNR